MELTQSSAHRDYIKQIRSIEAIVDKATDGEINQKLLDDAQSKLDILAEKYQYDDKLGSAIYKLYELQAIIHYFNGNDDDALAFINHAIDERGENYPGAEKLKAQLNETINTIEPAYGLSKNERLGGLDGVGGWLALFVVGLFIDTGITLYNFFQDGVSLASSDIDSLNQYQTGLGDKFNTITTFENIALVTYIALLVTAIILIFRRSRLAKGIAIAGLAFGAIYSVIDYAVASSLFDSSGLTQYVQSVLSKSASYAGRDTVAALIWIPYFLTSKRVKATLTK